MLRMKFDALYQMGKTTIDFDEILVVCKILFPTKSGLRGLEVEYIR
jgi:hypothetical protein